jgi:hypothetical protein
MGSMEEDERNIYGGHGIRHASSLGNIRTQKELNEKREEIRQRALKFVSEAEFIYSQPVLHDSEFELYYNLMVLISLGICYGWAFPLSIACTTVVLLLAVSRRVSWLLTHSLPHSPTHSAHSLTQLTHSAHSLTQLTHSLSHSLTHSAHPLTQSLTQLTHSLSQLTHSLSSHIHSLFSLSHSLSHSLTLSLTLSLSHSHTHSQSLIYTNTHRHTHTLTHTHTHSLSSLSSLSHSLTHSLTQLTQLT